MDLPTFRLTFPEFSGALDPFVTQILALATNEVDTCIYGGLYDAAHGYLTAHYLATSPMGQNARMVAKDGSTTYWKNYARLRAAATMGFRVA